MGLVCAAVGVAIRNSHTRRLRRARDEAGTANPNRNGIAPSLLIMMPVTVFGASPKASEVGVSTVASTAVIAAPRTTTRCRMNHSHPRPAFSVVRALVLLGKVALALSISVA